MAKSQLDKEQAAKVLTLAAAVGDRQAAKHFGVSIRTLQRYRVRMVDDPEVSQAVAEKKAELDEASRGWAIEAVAFMSLAIVKLSQLVEEATAAQIRDVAGAIKIVGELDITRRILKDDEHPSADCEHQAAQKDEGGVPGSAKDRPESTSLIN